MEVHIVSQGVLLKIRGDLTSRAMIGLIERYTPEEDGNVERIRGKRGNVTDYRRKIKSISRHILFISSRLFITHVICRPHIDAMDFPDRSPSLSSRFCILALH